jgi:DNA-binding CsgD family transcriptional regulator
MNNKTKEIMKLLATGHSRQDIGKQLGINPVTIGKFVQEIHEHAIVKGVDKFVAEIFSNGEPNVKHKALAPEGYNALRCHTCRFCSLQFKECRAEPPARDPENKAVWPIIAPMNDWCGYYEKR